MWFIFAFYMLAHVNMFGTNKLPLYYEIKNCCYVFLWLVYESITQRKTDTVLWIGDWGSPHEH